MSLLGSMIQDAAVANECFLIVKPDDFYVPAHHHVATCIQELRQEDVAVDYITLSDKLRRRGWLEEVGGEEYLVRLAESVASSANGSHYARIVQENSRRRQSILIAGEFIKSMYDKDQNSAERIERAMAELGRIDLDGEIDSITLAQAIDELLAIKSDPVKARGMMACRVPWKEMGRYIECFCRGWCVVLGGRSSSGKSAAAIQILKEASQDGHRGLYISLEMRGYELAARVLSMDSGIPINLHDEKDLLTGETVQRISASAAKARTLPVRLLDCTGASMELVEAQCRREMGRDGLDLVVIDHVGLMRRPESESNTVAVEALAIWTKRLARKLNICVFALHQIGRGANRKGNGTEDAPQMTDLLGSSAIEQNADVVILTHRPHPKSHERDERAEAYLIVDKVRMGRTGVVPATFDENAVTFWT